MTAPIKKRKAQEQLSPYSQDVPNEESDQKPDQDKVPRPSRKARVKKDAPLDKPSLKGIFGNVSLGGEPKISDKTEKDEMMAGLNSSFVKSVQIVVDRQSNKDLRYLFEQYSNFLNDIERNSK